MSCPIFKRTNDDFCLKDTCRYFDSEKEQCVYETLQHERQQETDEAREEIRESKANVEGIK